MKKMKLNLFMLAVAIMVAAFAKTGMATLSDYNTDFDGGFGSAWNMEHGTPDFVSNPGWLTLHASNYGPSNTGAARAYEWTPDLSTNGEYDLSFRFRPSATTGAQQGFWQQLDPFATDRSIKFLYYRNDDGMGGWFDGLAILTNSGLVADLPGVRDDIIGGVAKRNSTPAEIADNGRTYLYYAHPGDAAWTYITYIPNTNNAGQSSLINMLTSGYGGTPNPEWDYFHVGTAGSIIPEPATLMVLGFGSLFALRRRKASR